MSSSVSFTPRALVSSASPARPPAVEAPICSPGSSAAACAAAVVTDAGNDLIVERAPVRDVMADMWGRFVGVMGMLGLRYAVKPYQAQVSEALWRGSRVDEADIVALADRGFRGIVDLRRESNSDEAPARLQGMAHLRVPIVDNDHPSLEQVREFLAFASKPEHQPVYVHCQAGKGRTGVMVAAYRMAVEGWSLPRALAEAESFGLRVPNQKAFLRELAKEIAAGRLAAS